RFQQDFINWESGNEVVDKFIQDVQLRARNPNDIIEWIPFENLKNIKYLAKGGFGVVSTAKWPEGYMVCWDHENQIWDRCSNKYVCLKSLNDSANISSEFLKEVQVQLKFRRKGSAIPIYGITQDPKTNDFMIVMDYAENESLRRFLDKFFNKLSWADK
ncbi:17541_t:CDS:2, partial [Acaulospora morrowiae]